MNNNIFDLIIIGAGPAGLTSAIYSTRAGLNTIVIESYLNVSQIGLTEKIENYPGIVEPIKGVELLDRMKKQAKNFGAQFILKDGIKYIEKVNNYWKVKVENLELTAIAVIVATGCKPKELGVEGEAKFKGRGVSYCAVCDALFFKDKEVVVIGGGDTAIEEALYLTKFVQKVYIIHRRDRLRATKILQERAMQNKKIELVLNSVITEIYGAEKIDGVKVKNLKNNETSNLKCDGVFIYIGNEPNTGFLKGIVEMDDNGYIITDRDMRTSADGIFAAGDCIVKNLRQVSTAVGDGAVAANSARLYIEKFKGIEYI